MLFKSPLIFSFAFFILAGGSVFAGDYLTKEGNLAHQLKIIEIQGGFAGYTGMQFTIAPDGTWTSESIFNQKTTPKDKGKLSQKDLAKLAGILEKYELAKLPAESGKQPGANPRTITLEFGKQKASLVGQTPLKLDPKKPTGTVESRFAGITEGVIGMLMPPPKEEQKD